MKTRIHRIKYINDIKTLYLKLIKVELCVFFFSSRRRHTRYIGDWSSDVCSSDLGRASASRFPARRRRWWCRRYRRSRNRRGRRGTSRRSRWRRGRREWSRSGVAPPRSEERRVGKGGGPGGSQRRKKKRWKERERE